MKKLAKVHLIGQTIYVSFAFYLGVMALLGDFTFSKAMGVYLITMAIFTMWLDKLNRDSNNIVSKLTRLVSAKNSLIHNLHVHELTNQRLLLQCASEIINENDLFKIMSSKDRIDSYHVLMKKYEDEIQEINS